MLKSLPFRVERLKQVEGLKDIGGHALKVIQVIVQFAWWACLQSYTGNCSVCWVGMPSKVYR